MKVAFIGSGKMGKPIARNMLKSEAEVILYARKPEILSEFKELGATVTNTLLDTIEADIIFLCLPNTKIVQDIILGQKGLLNHLKKGQIIVDFSTINYKATVEIAEILGEKKVLFMDAPISGMETRATDGTLTIMCGGDEELFNNLNPYFKCVASNILYMGDVGNGQLTKLINQLLFDINVAALAEILPMSVKLGLDSKKIGEVVNSGTARSYASEFFIPRILKNDFSEGYPMARAYKDLINGAEIGAQHTIPLPVLAAATSTYQTALCKGYGNDNKGSMIHIFEELLNIKFRDEKY